MQCDLPAQWRTARNQSGRLGGAAEAAADDSESAGLHNSFSAAHRERGRDANERLNSDFPRRAARPAEPQVSRLGAAAAADGQ